MQIQKKKSKNQTNKQTNQKKTPKPTHPKKSNYYVYTAMWLYN